MELPAKKLHYFLRSNESNINQSQLLDIPSHQNRQVLRRMRYLNWQSGNNNQIYGLARVIPQVLAQTLHAETRKKLKWTPLVT